MSVPALRLAERELDEAIGHLAGSIGWNRMPAGAKTTGNLAICSAVFKSVSSKWVHARSSRARQIPDHLLGRRLRAEIAEHGAIDGTGHRHGLVTDHRDIDDVPNARASGCTHEVSGLDIVALGGASQVHDDVAAPAAWSTPSPVLRSAVANSTPSGRVSSCRPRAKARTLAALYEPLNHQLA